MGLYDLVKNFLIHLSGHRHRPLERFELPEHVDHPDRRLCCLRIGGFGVPLIDLSASRGKRLIGQGRVLLYDEKILAFLRQNLRTGEIHDLQLV